MKVSEFQTKKKNYTEEREGNAQRQSELLTPEKHMTQVTAEGLSLRDKNDRGLEPETHLRGLGSVRKI